MRAARRDLVALFRERGLLHQVTDEALGPLSAKESITAYIGFDPTAPSLHAGSLYPVMLLAQLGRVGHQPIPLLGGGTGLIGDPGGRDEERPLIAEEEARANLEAMKAQVGGLLEKAEARPLVLDNAEWLRPLLLVDFLRDVGKHFTVNWMMAKDSVRARLEDRHQGISYTEFAYMLLQAYDYYRLWKDRGCRLQMGASDQWGNITAGIELIRRREGGEAFGLTCPLLLTPDGKKFGKSAGNAVWLDAKLTSPYRFYQFWMNQEDALAATLLAAYTFLPMEEVAALRADASKAPENRLCQRRLAREVTTFVHGKDAAGKAEKASGVLFGEGSIRDLDAETLQEAFAEVRSTEISAKELGATPLGKLFVKAGLVPSMSEFARLFKQQAVYVNGDRLPVDHPGTLESREVLHGRFVVLRRGKKDYALVRVVDG